MKIVGLLGGPRPDGCSSVIANHFFETVKRLTGEVQTFDLNKLKYKHCQDRLTCKSFDDCVLEDDLTAVLAAIRAADVLVIATPLYFGDLTERVKVFVERTNCFIGPDFLTSTNPSRLKPGKKLVFIITQEEPDESQFADVYKRYDYFFRWCGFHDNHLIRACGVSEAGTLEGHRDVLRLAEEMAKKLVA